MTRSADAFAMEFAQFWAAPDPARLDLLLHPDVVLIQPFRRPVRGLAAAKDYFRNLVDLRPGVRGDVVRHAATREGDATFLYLDWVLRLPLGGVTRDVPMVDRFNLVEGFAIERVAYLDVLPLLGPMLLGTPIWRWPRLMK